jgi:hypothetical protein
MVGEPLFICCVDEMKVVIYNFLRLILFMFVFLKRRILPSFQVGNGEAHSTLELGTPDEWSQDETPKATRTNVRHGRDISTPQGSSVWHYGRKGVYFNLKLVQRSTRYMTGLYCNLIPPPIFSRILVLSKQF